MSPRISIILPVYNTEKYLANAIESIFAQTSSNIELICVNDGSTDRSLEILKSFGDRLRVIDLKQNVGIAGARNAGIARARGEFFAFMDADDLWEPNKLETQLEQFKKNPTLDISFAHMHCFLSSELPDEVKQLRECPPNPMPGYVAATMLIKSSAFHRVGLFHPAWRVGEFIDWFEQAKAKGLTYELLDDVFLKRRIHATNTGVTDRASRMDYVKIVRAALERKRQSNV